MSVRKTADQLYLDAYTHGWMDGASVKPWGAHTVIDEVVYDRAYRDGREAFHVAVNAERARLGMAPSKDLRLASHAERAAGKTRT